MKFAYLLCRAAMRACGVTVTFPWGWRVRLLPGGSVRTWCGRVEWTVERERRAPSRYRTRVSLN